jgi:type II secretory pathway pseudopilin PulG
MKLQLKLKSTAAFSLIELIIYIAISSIMVTSLMLFSIEILEVRGGSQMDREIMENARFAMDLITREVRDSEGVSVSSPGVHPSTVTLTLDGGASTIDIDIVDGRLRRDGVNFTTSDVTVTNFTANELTRDAEPENIQVFLTVKSAYSADEVSLQTSISLRE